MASVVLSFLGISILGIAASVFSATDVETLIQWGTFFVSAVATLVATARYGFRKQTLVWIAGAVAGAVAVAVAGAFAGAGAGAGAVAFAVAGAGAVAFAVAGAGAVAGAVAFTEGSDQIGVMVAAILLPSYQLYLSWRIRKKDDRFDLAIDGARSLQAIGGTRFTGADLTEACFAGTGMAGVRLGAATLTRVNWRTATGLDESVHEDAVLGQVAVRELATTGDGQKRNYVRLNLHGINLTDSDLREANLREANLTGAVLRGADLTGACIESWNIDATTEFRGVQCRYVYLLEQPDGTGSRKRRPADPERNFEPGEFATLFGKVLEEMEVLLKKGLSREAMREAFVELQTQHPEVSIRKFENREEHVLVSLDVPAGTAEAAVERTLVSSWEVKLLLAESKIGMLEAHNRDITQIALAAAAAGVQIGDRKMEDKSIHVHQGGLTIKDSQVASLSGDVSQVVQSLQQSGGPGAAELAAVLSELMQGIAKATQLSEIQRVQAKAQVETLAVAAKAPAEEASKSAAAKAWEGLLALVGKLPDLVKLVEAGTKAWEVVAK